MSHSRIDEPKDLRRRLRDCKDSYEIEPVGSVDQTHRYRGLSDFHYSTTHAPFMNKFKDTIMTGDYTHVKEFKLDPAMGVRENTELIPPPILTDHTIPFNWGYHQNPTIKIAIDPLTGQKTVFNHSTPAKLGTLYIPHDIPVAPTQPLSPPPQDPVLLSLIAELNAALDERPIWTRRAITNRVSASPGIYLLKPAIQYVGYQFRGGPWRDAIIKYGIDPRTDPKYRFYQTLFFKIFDEQEKVPGMPWLDIRSEYTRKSKIENTALDTHIFDGKSLSLDGKVWQVCDVTDPTIQKLASTKHLREVCDPEIDGWYCNGTWAKIKTVMRAKITAIRAGKEVPESAFKATLEIPDEVEIAGNVKGKKLNVPIPDLRKYGVLEANPGKEGVKRKRMRIASRRWGKKDGRKIVKGKGKKKDISEDEDDEEEDEEMEGDDEDVEEETALPKEKGGNYEPPTLRKRSTRAAVKGKGKEVADPIVDLGDIYGDEDAEGDEDVGGHDEDDDAAGMFGGAAPVADEDDDVSEYEGDE